ncbi:MAG TPA: H-NS family nucleoid-associated regulatory protein [Xanthobacteraceae bacterium]|nr:H-NS family nucleoid-associated regulatory protein [Xanthobacteraceae bacterium]
MAKKAKRRGRPPGAKSPDKMDIGQLREYIAKLQSTLSKKVSEQRAYFEEKLSELTGIGAPKKRGRPVGSGSAGAKKKGTRKKATPKYRSRKDPKVVWSGRGVTPVWMRDEMKGTKLKKDDFLIKAA